MARTHSVTTFLVTADSLAVISLLVSSLTTPLPCTLCSNKRLFSLKTLFSWLCVSAHDAPFAWQSSPSPFSVVNIYSCFRIHSSTPPPEMFPLPATPLFQSQSENTPHRTHCMEDVASLPFKAYFVEVATCSSSLMIKLLFPIPGTLIYDFEIFCVSHKCKMITELLSFLFHYWCLQALFPR